MNEPVQCYMRVGIVHFMAYPECMGGEGPVVETLMKVIEDPFFDVVEMAPAADPAVRRDVARRVSEARVELSVGAQPVQLARGLDLNHADSQERERAVSAVRECIDHAAEMGAHSVMVMSGKACPDREDALTRLIGSLSALCDHAAARGLRLVLETFDQAPFGKNCLIGPTGDAACVADAVRGAHPDFGLAIDLSHLPLQEEVPEYAVRTAGVGLVHAHIGNCAMDDPAHEAYGDQHPRFGADGTRNDVAELTEFVRALLHCGYLSRERRGIVSFEVRPMRGESPEAVIAGSKRALIAAWRDV